MKSIMLVDTPKSCSMCKVRNICEVWNEELVKWKGYNDRLDNCPLRPLPEKKNIDIEPVLSSGNTYEDGYNDGIEHSFDIGWNACIDEITGDSE